MFEARFTKPPRLTLNDGCVPVGAGSAEPWHLHLCIGPHRGTTRRPTPPELARWRRCARLDADTMRPVRVADWSRLAVWMDLRERFAGVPVEPPPADATPPALH